MKQVALIVKEDGLIYVNEVPEEPKFVDTMEAVENCLNDKAMSDYRKAINNSAILCADQEKAHGIIWRNHASQKDRQQGNEIKPGIYPIPDLQWGVRIHCDEYHAHTKPSCKLAILTLSEQPKVEESNEKLMDELLTEYRDMRRRNATTFSIQLHLCDKFTITRNLKENQ